MGMWSKVACFLEDWALPQDWWEVEVKLEAAEVALGKIRKFFVKERAHNVAGTVCWLFLLVLKKVMDEKEERASARDMRNGSKTMQASKCCGFFEE